MKVAGAVTGTGQHVADDGLASAIARLGGATRGRRRALVAVVAAGCRERGRQPAAGYGQTCATAVIDRLRRSW